jgi:hypothetical protein
MKTEIARLESLIQQLLAAHKLAKLDRQRLEERVRDLEGRLKELPSPDDITNAREALLALQKRLQYKSDSATSREHR